MADVLKEFLVSLGFKTDEAGLRRFTQQLQSTHRVVRGFAVAVGAMAVGAEEAIRRTAKQFENLFYLSQQTGVAVNTIKGLESAFRQVGLSAGEADAAIAGLDTLFRDMPGMRAFARQWTGTDAPDQVILRLAQRYKEILAIADVGRRQAAEAQFRSGILAPLGLDPTSLLRLGQNIEAGLQGKRFQERLAKAFGIDPQQAAADATELERIFNEMWATIKTGADTLIVTTFPTLRKLLEDFTKWLSTEGAAHVKRWGDNLNKFLNDPELLPAIERAFKAIGTAVGEIVTGIENWIGKEHGLDNTKAALIGIAGAVKDIVDGITWLIAHPTVASVLGGAAAGGAVAGPPGALVAGGAAGIASTMRPRGDPRGTDESWLHYELTRPLNDIFEELNNSSKDSKSGFDLLKKWIIGGEKGTPWVKIEDTDKPLTIVYAAEVYDRLMNGFRTLLGLPTIGPTATGQPVAQATIGPTATGQPVAQGVSRSPPIGHEHEYQPQPGRGRFGAVPRPIPRERSGGAGGGRGGEVPHQPQSVYEAISQAEGTFERGQINYNEVLGKGRYGRPDKPLTEMSLSEAYQFGRSVLHRHGSSSAIGAFQIVGRTMMDAVKALGLSMSEKFSPENQKRMADWIFKTQGSHAWEGFKTHPNLRHVAESMASHRDIIGASALGADRRDRNVNVDSDHKVEINVHGATDAHGTARAVRDAQDRHSALHARNLRTAIA